MVCRSTDLSDEAHVDFSRYFGELDDVRPYIDAGRKHRLPYPELFDAGNIDPDSGDVAPLSAAQVIGNKVCGAFDSRCGPSLIFIRRTSYSTLTRHSMLGELATPSYWHMFFLQLVWEVPPR